MSACVVKIRATSRCPLPRPSCRRRRTSTRRGRMFGAPPTCVSQPGSRLRDDAERGRAPSCGQAPGAGGGGVRRGVVDHEHLQSTSAGVRCRARWARVAGSRAALLWQQITTESVAAVPTCQPSSGSGRRRATASLTKRMFADAPRHVPGRTSSMRSWHQQGEARGGGDDGREARDDPPAVLRTAERSSSGALPQTRDEVHRKGEQLRVPVAPCPSTGSSRTAEREGREMQQLEGHDGALPVVTNNKRRDEAERARGHVGSRHVREERDDARPAVTEKQGDDAVADGEKSRETGTEDQHRRLHAALHGPGSRRDLPRPSAVMYDRQPAEQDPDERQ